MQRLEKKLKCFLVSETGKSINGFSIKTKYVYFILKRNFCCKSKRETNCWRGMQFFFLFLFFLYRRKRKKALSVILKNLLENASMEQKKIFVWKCRRKGILLRCKLEMIGNEIFENFILKYICVCDIIEFNHEMFLIWKLNTKNIMLFQINPVTESNFLRFTFCCPLK